MNKTRLRSLEDMLISKEKLKSEDSSLRLDCTSDGLRASISCIESNKIEQATETVNLIDNEWEQGNIPETTGKPTDATTLIRTKNFQNVFPNHLYKISRNISTSYMSYRFYDINYNYLGNQITTGMLTTNKIDNRMQAEQTSMEMTILNTEVAYMKIIDASNDLSTIYTMTTEAVNIDYPSNIEGVTGVVKLKVQTKNLVDSKDITLEGISVLNFKAKLNKEYFVKLITENDSDKEVSNVCSLFLSDGSSNLYQISSSANSISKTKYNAINTVYHFKITDKEIIDKCKEIRLYINKEVFANNGFSKVKGLVVSTEEISEYVEHKEQKFTISLKDKILYKGDKIVRKDGKWYFNKKFKIRDFSKNPLTHVPDVVSQGYYFVINNIKGSKGNRATIYSNLQKVVKNAETAEWKKLDGNLIGQLYPESHKGIYVNYKPATQQEFINWWNALGVVLVYELENSELEEITDELLIEQLNAILLKIREYDDVTNFDFDNDVVFEITVEKDNIRILNSRFDELEQNTTSAQMLALEQEV